MTPKKTLSILAGLYIHIPFCASRCIYCGFYSTTHNKAQDRYISAICKEMKMRKTSSVISTVYIGGGTPSQLQPLNISRLFKSIEQNYNINPKDKGCNIEVTMECNPDDIDDTLCETMERCGVNRVSMGVQTFNNNRLSFLKRRHKAEDIPKAIETLRHHGIMNISIDLMFGFPQQTLDEWRTDILKAINLNVEHISAYSLTFEENTPLHSMLEKGKLKEADEELWRTMFITLMEMLESAGYEHYEISNFARKGTKDVRSRHNLSYWNDIPYIGLGASAHSYDGDYRSWNVSDIERYIKGIEDGKPVYDSEGLDMFNKYDETIMTRLRTCKGIYLNDIKKKFGNEFHDYLIRQSQRFIAKELLCLRDGYLCLTRKGILVSDDIMSDLFY